MTRRSPYQGLIPYTEEDSPYFFGREAEREIIEANLRASALTVLYGASGVGKSSVLRAGVLRNLKSAARMRIRRGKPPEMIAIYCHEWREDPIAAVVTAAQHALADLALDLPSPNTNRLRAILDRCSEVVENRLAVVLDQFEEYLLYHRRAESYSEFDEELAEVVTDPNVRVNVLIAIREDALAKLDHYKGRLHSVFENYLRIDHLDSKAAGEAITRPVPVYCKAAGIPAIEVEPELVSEVIHQVETGRVSFQEMAGRVDVAGGDGSERIEAPYLQLVLTRLWEEELREGSTSLRRDTLRRLGEAENIVKSHLDEVMNTFSEQEREVAERVFFHLVTPSGTKVAHAVSDLAAFTGLEQTSVARVIEKLANREHRILRLVPPLNPVAGIDRYEIYHDALAEAILAWQQRFRSQLAQKRLASELEDRQRQEREELERQREKEKARLLKVLLAIATGAIVVIGVLAWNSWQGWRQAQEQRTVAETAVSAEQAQRQVAERAMKQAEQSSEQLRKGFLIRQAALSGDQAQLNALVAALAENKQVRFRAMAQDLGYRNSQGQTVYQFRLYPDKASLPQGEGSVAFITYLANHPTFHNTLMTANAQREFAVTYIGWGCLTRVVAVIEYSDPTKTPTVTTYNMCSELGW